ncbi:hypothetical protein STEG23_013292 [Scotinomys teguina]
MAADITRTSHVSCGHHALLQAGITRQRCTAAPYIRFYKLLLRSSWFAFFPAMILPRVAIRAAGSSVFMNILFVCIDLSLTSLEVLISYDVSR